MKKVLIPAVLLLLLVGTGLIVFKFYEYIFAKTITGVIVKVERIHQENMLITSGAKPVPAEQMFSFAVAIKDKTAEIHTASSEDRQWAVAQVGQCVEAKYFPYPPWQLSSWGTFHNARLLRLHDCPPLEPSPGGGAGIAPGEFDPPRPTDLPTALPSPIMTLAPATTRKDPALVPMKKPSHVGPD